jgi:hypothetical protein
MKIFNLCKTNTELLSKNCGHINPESLDEALVLADIKRGKSLEENDSEKS